MANPLTERRATRGVRTGPWEPSVMVHTEVVATEDKKMVREESSKDGRLERQLVMVDEEIPLGVGEHRGAIVLSSKDEGESQHHFEGVASEECKVREEIQNTTGDKQPLMLLTTRGKRSRRSNRSSVSKRYDF